MLGNAMRRIWIALKGDWLPWPAVFPVVFLGVVGLDLLFLGVVHVKADIAIALGVTIGAVSARHAKKREPRRNA
jgi:hypothetical protein